MSLARVEYVARGRGPYTFQGLDYLLVAHLAAEVNGSPVSAAFDEQARTMTLAADPPAGATVAIVRTTPRRREERLVDFLDLPDGRGGLTADLLDTDYRQNMLLMGEARDVATDIPPMDGVSLGDDLQWDAQGLRLENLAVGASPADAVVKSQIDAVAAAARPLPVVSGADNDDGLFVTAGEFAKRTPTQGRAHLALGTAAVLDTGVAATNVVKLDSSARYPTADGRNIDLTNHAIQAEINKRARATVVKTTRLTAASPNTDPTVSTWSQASGTRFNFSGTSWTNRVELNNSSDVDGSFSPGRFDLSAGTWRVRWFLKVRQTNAAGLPFAFRITNNDDTSAQVIYADYGLNPFIKRQFNGGQLYYAVFLDQLLIGNASPFSLVFRWTMFIGGANNDADLGVLFHKVSTSVLA